VIEMACDRTRSSDSDAIHSKSIVDVGCDHGLLTMGLAASGCFQRVIGVDVSVAALERGAFILYQDVITTTTTTIPYWLSQVEFRVGDGIHGLVPGEADVICIAGMGFQTMIAILTSHVKLQEEEGDDEKSLLLQTQGTNNSRHDDDSSSRSTTPILQLDRLACQELYLQPANSKPIYLMELYDTLQDIGWYVAKEHLSEISSRWYMTTMWKRRTTNDPCVRQSRHNVGSSKDDGSATLSLVNNKDLPGCKFMTLETSHAMKQHYERYVAHHTQWMKSDLTKKSKLDDREIRWLQYTSDGWRPS
jgi:tRNA A22 N-methylase